MNTKSKWLADGECFGMGHTWPIAKHSCFKQEEKMITHFSDAFTDKEHNILAKTFQANCQHLGIDDADCTVLIHRHMLGPKRKQGVMSCLAPDKFLVMLNSEGINLFEGISVLGHEAVHIRQYLRGDLSDDKQ